MTTRQGLVTVLLVVLAQTPPCQADQGSEADSPHRRSAYWNRQRDGWFWYREPPPQPRKNSPADDKRTPPAPAKPRELTDLETLQARLEHLKRVAVMNPTDGNLLAYMRLQRQVMQRAQVFAQRWQRLVWTTPELDASLGTRPTNATAIGVHDTEEQKRQADIIRTLSATHGVVFVFRSDCPYCHRMAPILKQFERQFGMTVFPVSLDGRGLPDYPNPHRDNGIAQKLEAAVVPAIYLTEPANRVIRPIGFGVMALTELAERIVTLVSPLPETY